MSAAPPTSGILEQLIDAAKALGIMRPDGSIDSSWFEHPLQRIGRVFGDESQRDALLRLLDDILPAAAGVAPTGSRWYPLLGPLTGTASSNAYLTVDARPGETFVGLAGSLSGSTGGANPLAGACSLRARSRPRRPPPSRTTTFAPRSLLCTAWATLLRAT